MRSDGSFICTFRAFRRGDEAAVHGLLADAPSTAVWRDGTAHDEFERAASVKIKWKIKCS